MSDSAADVSSPTGAPRPTNAERWVPRESIDRLRAAANVARYAGVVAEAEPEDIYLVLEWAEAASLNTSASRSPDAAEAAKALLDYLDEPRVGGGVRVVTASTPEVAALRAVLNADTLFERDHARWMRNPEYAEQYRVSRAAALPAQREPARAASAARHTTPELDAAIRRVMQVLDNDEGAAEMFEAARDLYAAETQAASTPELERRAVIRGLHAVICGPDGLHQGTHALDADRFSAAYRDATREPAPAAEAEELSDGN